MSEKVTYQGSCRHCGIYPFHDGDAHPAYRINLGCVAEIDDRWSLPIKVFDGRGSWKFLD